jgi:general secretion pathway protein G
MGRSESRSGFTFIEILIVLVLLGIVGVTFVPQLTAASNDARREAVEQGLAMMRRQIKSYHNHHQQYPAHGTNSKKRFLSHLTEKTNHAGDVNAAGRFGPYVIGGVPVNAYTQQNSVLVVPGELRAHQFAGHGDHGWAYSSTTGEFRANLSPNVTNQDDVPVNRL